MWVPGFSIANAGRKGTDMIRRMMIAVLALSLGVLAIPGLAAERTARDADTAAKGEVTDSWLTLKAKLALLGDERISSVGIQVTTQEGIVKLRGKVASEAEQEAAGEAAGTIEEAREVDNQLTVGPQMQRKSVDRQDDQIVTDVKQAIAKDASLKKAAIDARAEKGIVTLTGKAPSLATSVRASETTRRVSGVRAVRNELILR